jgi:hypothetical protein
MALCFWRHLLRSCNSGLQQIGWHLKHVSRFCSRRVATSTAAAWLMALVD